MSNLYFIEHKVILKKILKERGINITDFAVQIGYGRTNYTPYLNQPMYTQELIQKICAALEVDPSTFPMHSAGPAAIQVNESGENVNQKNLGQDQELSKELLAVYRSALAAKDAAIAAKDSEIALLRERIDELRSKR